VCAGVVKDCGRGGIERLFEDDAREIGFCGSDFQSDIRGDSPYDIPSFTLGSVNVSPMTMAAAYAAVAARGVYCEPIAIQRIVDRTGAHLPVKSAGCHQVLSPQVADAAIHILQGVLVSPGTAAGDQFSQNGVVPPQAANMSPKIASATASLRSTSRTSQRARMLIPLDQRRLGGHTSDG